MPIENSQSMTEKAGKYLTFGLGDEEYGLEILKVREIIGMMKVTRVPGAPDFVRGVINLRGKVIPVIDLRLKFAMPPQPDTEKTCIIVVQVRMDQRAAAMGVIVDEVREVIDIKADQIEPPPVFGASVQTEFILGMGKISQKISTLLDIDRALSAGEARMVEQAVEGS